MGDLGAFLDLDAIFKGISKYNQCAREQIQKAEQRERGLSESDLLESSEKNRINDSWVYGPVTLDIASRG